MTALALTIAATTIAAGRVAPDGTVSDVRQEPTPTSGVWDTCRLLLRDLAGVDEITSIGIGSAGPIDMAAGIIAPADINEWMSGFDIASATRELFPHAAIGLAVEGVCLALAERRYGQAHDVTDAMTVSLSTHVTAGIILGGFVLVGHTGNTGNIGHMVIGDHDELCPCGGRGCLDTIASAAATSRWAATQGWTATTADELIAAAQAGEPIPTAALHRAGTALGQAIASAAALLDLNLVIIGGPLAHAGPAVWHPLTHTIATHARLSFLSTLRVVPSALDATAALTGAALLAAPAPQPA